MPAVCRGDRKDVDLFHCSLPRRLGRSGNVKVNGIGISRENDYNTVHLKTDIPRCRPHIAPIATGSTTVFINSKGCGRVGDAISGCTSVASGSENVFAGG